MYRFIIYSIIDLKFTSIYVILQILAMIEKTLISTLSVDDVTGENNRLTGFLRVGFLVKKPYIFS